ncbi:hypothetical protein KY348_04395 [Candidatus Woesearchaeota archaeon]|nr:hypothetical protein [Candidatus Woesearchaeota archaeon]
MVAQKSIETGVDKLVNLINRRKKITTTEAANELGVSVPVIQEWADFLEDEGLITIDFKLSRTYLCERKLSKKEVEKKARVYSSKKDAFTRKVDTALKSLQRESEGFKKIKEEFAKLRDTIGSDLEQVKEELQELKHYEDLKKNIDKDIIQQKLDYQEMLKSVRQQIAEQKKKYEKYIEEIGVEKGQIEEAMVELGFLEKRESNLKKRLDALKEIIKSLENKIVQQKGIVKGSVDKAKTNLKQAQTLQKDIAFRMRSELEPIIKVTEDKEKKVLALQDSLLKKVMARKRKIDKYKLESMQAAEKFKTFFERKAKIQEFINALEKSRADMEKELHALIMKAKSFNLSIKSSDVQNYVKELQKSFKQIENKKNDFTKKLGQLTDMISKE